MNSARRTHIAGQFLGCNMVARRAVIERVGLFDEDFGPGALMQSGDETEYMFRAYLAGIAFEHVPDMSKPARPLAVTECFDIFSPAAGDRDVITQLDRLSSNEMKIAPRSTRIAACAGRSREVSSATSLCQSAPVAIHTPIGSSVPG